MESPPRSILILGHGVFGLSTALSLSLRPSFKNTKITLIDRSPFPSPDGSSIDTSRIIRPDYSDPAYAKMGAEAMEIWRSSSSSASTKTGVAKVLAGLGEEGRYTESGLVLVCNKGKQGEKYVRETFENMVLMATDKQKVKELKNRREIDAEMGTGGGNGDWGYVNTTSGWADAEAGMRFLRKKVEALGRVTFLQGEADSLIHSSSLPSKILGIKLTNGSTHHSDLTILATGAWTGKLVDLRGRATATGQVLCYMPITPSEQEKLSKAPVLLNMSTGMFIIPPPSPSSKISNTKPALLKIARHGYGYTSPISIPNPNPNPNPSPSPSPSPSSPSKNITISLPRTTWDNPTLSVPLEGQLACRSALKEMLPSLYTPSRPFTSSRICWYTDTPTGNFLITFHPQYSKSLFLATGGSGHGYKFLPVIGERIVDCIEERGHGWEEFGGEGGRWEWREKVGDNEVVTEDGSRGGKMGMRLDEEMRKGEARGRESML